MTTDRETAKCCRGAGDHEEWCHKRSYEHEATTARGPHRQSKQSKLAKRRRTEARRHEKRMIAARTRILVEVSERVASDPSRINSAFADVVTKFNATLQTEEAWRAVWSVKP